MNDILLLDLICGASKALDYVSPTVTGHHRRVAIAAAATGKTLGLPQDDMTDLLIGALLHDVGAFSLDIKLDGLDFDADLTEHSIVGYRLLRDHPLLKRAALLIRFHHTHWKDLQKQTGRVDDTTLLLGNLLNLMDRVDILGKVGVRTFNSTSIRNIIRNYSSAVYSKDVIDAFMETSADPAFWEAIEGERRETLRCIVDADLIEKRIPHDQLIDFSRFFTRIIDFRSRHTATHSLGVAEVAVQLATLAGMNDSDQERMRLAGNLHDIGKLGVPVRLLDKPGKLDGNEYESVQNHAVICETVLRSIPGLEDIADWACQHHERLNGKGYPHGLKAKDLSLGSRIIAVADVYTAITEDRPYREGMGLEKARNTLRSMASSGFLDSDLVELLVDNAEHVDSTRRMVQSRAYSEFKRFHDF